MTAIQDRTVFERHRQVPHPVFVPPHLEDAIDQFGERFLEFRISRMLRLLEKENEFRQAAEDFVAVVGEV